MDLADGAKEGGRGVCVCVCVGGGGGVPVTHHGKKFKSITRHVNKV